MQELLQTEWQDETDRFLDNRFEEQVAPTPKNSELPPGLLRYVVAEWQQLRRRETRQGGALLNSVASAPALVVASSSSNNNSGSCSGKTFRKQTRVQQQQQQQRRRHLAGAPPSVSKESGKGDDENENAPLLDV